MAETQKQGTTTVTMREHGITVTVREHGTTTVTMNTVQQWLP